MKSHPNIIYIKNMVCNRCIKVVKDELEKIGIKIKNISLGEVETYYPLTKSKLDKIKKVLEDNGFELIESRKARIVEKTKSIIINTIFNQEEFLISKKNFSELIEKEVCLDYNYLSSLFSSMEGITIEQYIILQKIERAKELLKYDELSLSEIAYRLGYSSVQHLSGQFKKITGFSARDFKKLTKNIRKPLDKISSPKSKS
ncbi:MAG: helix-turn-helix domain-containing protein [Melioribacter sp.]|nr:helix-turn-helix domain-containing protein [Melioribacter sp.]